MKQALEAAERVIGAPAGGTVVSFYVAVRFGVAAVVLGCWPRARAGLDLAALRAHLVDRLPGYARPVFVRIRPELDVTATFKYTKHELVRQGYDPAAVADTIYVDHPAHRAFVRLDPALHARIQTGDIRL